MTIAFASRTVVTLIKCGVKVLDELNPTKKPDCIVHSSAIKHDDPRLKKFKNLEIPFYHRGEFLPIYLPVIRLLPWWVVMEKPVFPEG